MLIRKKIKKKKFRENKRNWKYSKEKKNVKEIINDYDNYCDICFGKYETKKCNYG